MFKAFSSAKPGNEPSLSRVDQQGDDAGRMHGFQLWSNLPASLKMTAFG